MDGDLEKAKIGALSTSEREGLKELIKGLRKEYKQITVDISDKIDDSVNAYVVRIIHSHQNEGWRSDNRHYNYTTLNTLLVQMENPFVEDIVLETETRTQAESNVILEVHMKRQKTQLRVIRESDLNPIVSEDLFDATCNENGSKKQIEKQVYNAMCGIAAFINRTAVEEYDAAVQISSHAYRQIFNGIKSISLSHMTFLIKCYGNDPSNLTDIIFMPNGGHAKSHYRSALIFQFTRKIK